MRVLTIDSPGTGGSSSGGGAGSGQRVPRDSAIRGSRDDGGRSGCLDTRVDGSDAERLRAFLTRHRLSKYAAGLAELGVDAVEDLADLEVGDLDEMGMKKLEKRRLLKAVSKL